MPKNHLQLYLNGHAEEQALAVAKKIPDAVRPDHYLVVPARNEGIDCINRLQNHRICSKNLLIIIVINQPRLDDPDNTGSDASGDTGNITTAEHNNPILWNHIKNSGEAILAVEKCCLLRWPKNNTLVLMVNCFAPGYRLPSKQGVGLARKIGCDIACALIARQALKTGQAAANTWIHTTDADTHLPQDYLDKLPEEDAISALVYPFQHVGNHSTLTRATLLYEQSLRYYVDALKYAQSPYAFHTLGSCIATRANHYAQARGFPKRAGGEDFYLLNKLAKMGTVVKKTGEPLLIQARSSHRAPFGTGAAVAGILDREYDETSLPAYHPKVFMELKILLEQFHECYQYRESDARWPGLQSQPCQSALDELGAENLWRHLKGNGGRASQWQKHIHHWFDGFRTLKFIHCLERHYPKIPLDQARKSLFGLSEAKT